MSASDQERGRLSPTLWRTCRVLANRTRLRMLQHLMKHPNGTVSSVGALLGLPIATASAYLRALNARGVLLASREGPCVRYRMAPDPTVPEATVLVAGLEEELRRGGAGVDAAFRMLTAFTHPRRIAILAALSGCAGMSRCRLRRCTGISGSALDRHLDKLFRRDLVTKDDNVLRAVPPSAPLAKALLRMTVSSDA